MTLTQIYSQYVSVSEQLLMKEDENKKLNSYIDQILQVNKLLLVNIENFDYFNLFFTLGN